MNDVKRGQVVDQIQAASARIKSAQKIVGKDSGDDAELRRLLADVANALDYALCEVTASGSVPSDF